MANIKANIKYLKDESGNIISPVTSFDSVFTSTGGDIKQVLLDLVYPVGSIYISTKNVNPSQFLGGDWEQITDKFLLAAGSKYTAGSKGGSATKIISKENLPNYTLYSASHTHGVTDPGHKHAAGGYTYTTGHGNYPSLAASGTPGYALTTDRASTGISIGNTTITVNSGGSGTALDIMPPYEVVYAWKRVAYGDAGGSAPVNPT